MFYVSQIKTTPPPVCKTPLQKMVYDALAHLHIPYERVDTDEAITMEDCVFINRKLNIKMGKTLFLCNRRQTEFYLFITAGEKPFRTKEFSAALQISRVSFAPAALMEKMLGVKAGAATVFSTLLDSENAVTIVLDSDIASEEWFGCSDGTTTGYVKVHTDHLLHTFLDYTHHTPVLVQI